MDIDRLLVKSVLEQGIRPAIEAGVDSSSLMGQSQDVWDFIRSFYVTHGKIPEVATVSEECRLDSEYWEIECSEPLTFYIEKLRDRTRLNLLSAGLRESIQDIEDSQVEQAQEKIFALTSELATSPLLSNSVDYHGTAEDRYEKYLNEIGRIQGIPTPWASLTQRSSGIGKAQMWVVLGSKKIGKSFTSILFTEAAIADNKRTLFISLEMSVDEIMERMDAMRFRIPYSDFRNRQLSTQGWKDLRQRMSDLKEETRDRLLLFPASQAQTPADVGVLIRTYRPDLVVIDAVYKMRPNRHISGGKKYDQTSAMIEDLQTVMMSTEVPMVVTSQFNREVEKDRSSAGSTKVAFSYAFAQDAYAVLGMFRPESEVDNNRAVIRTLDSRGWPGIDMCINFDLKLMRFDEMYELEQGTMNAVRDATYVPAKPEKPRDLF